MKKALAALAALAALFSCNEPRIYYDLDIDGLSAVARKAKRGFCVVLVNHQQYPTGEYIAFLEENYRDLTRHAVFDIVDVEKPENDWYVKWLCPVSVPLTCVFSPVGELTDLIPGSGEESFSHIVEAVEQAAITGFHWPNRFDLDKARAVPILRDIQLNKKYVENGAFMARDVDALADSLRYPYSLWLQLSGRLMTGDTISARKAAMELLELGTPYNLATYKTEFITANKVVDPGFEIGNEPNIRVGSERILLGDLPASRIASFDVTVHNDGNKPLTVTKVITDCGCLRRLGGMEAFTVSPRDSVELSFALSPAVGEGEVRQEILLVSDGINNPLLKIKVRANFLSDI